MSFLAKNNKGAAEKGRAASTVAGHWKVLVVDDEPDIHAVTRMSLRDFEFDGRGITFLNAHSARDAREIVEREKDIAVALIDVVMETEEAGLHLVEHIRHKCDNWMTRLIIRTGQPGMAPERMVIHKYDIDNYKEKTDLTSQKLYTTMRAAIKSYRDLNVIEMNRQGLTMILHAIPHMYHVQPMQSFLEGALTQVTSLCNLGRNSLISATDCLLLTSEGERLTVCAGTGNLAGDPEANPRVREVVALCTPLLEDGNAPTALGEGRLVLPMRYDNRIVGFIYLEGGDLITDTDAVLLQVLANQCASSFQNIRLYNQIDAANMDFLYRLAMAAEFKDRCTGNHINRIVAYTTELCRMLGFDDQTAEKFGRASLLHDIGKLGVPDHILQKKGPLSDEEFDIIRRHPEIGTRLLGKGEWFDTARTVALSHHERWDGKGYPHGVGGTDIPLPARIVAVVDVLDALLSRRPYKDAWPLERALGEIQRGAGTQFDPDIVAALLRLHEDGGLAPISEKYPELPD